MIWWEVLNWFIVKIQFSLLSEVNGIWKFYGVHLFQFACNFSEFS